MRLTVASEVEDLFPEVRLAVAAIGGVRVESADSGLEKLVIEQTCEIEQKHSASALKGMRIPNAFKFLRSSPGPLQSLFSVSFDENRAQHSLAQRRVKSSMVHFSGFGILDAAQSIPEMSRLQRCVTTKGGGAAAGIRTRVVGFLRFRWMEGHWTPSYVLDQARLRPQTAPAVSTHNYLVFLMFQGNQIPHGSPKSMQLVYSMSDLNVMPK